MLIQVVNIPLATINHLLL